MRHLIAACLILLWASVVRADPIALTFSMTTAAIDPADPWSLTGAHLDLRIIIDPDRSPFIHDRHARETQWLLDPGDVTFAFTGSRLAGVHQATLANTSALYITPDHWHVHDVSLTLEGVRSRVFLPGLFLSSPVAPRLDPFTFDPIELDPSGVDIGPVRATDLRVSATRVPEPTTLSLLVLGAAGLLCRRRRLPLQQTQPAEP